VDAVEEDGGIVLVFDGPVGGAGEGVGDDGVFGEEGVAEFALVVGLDGGLEADQVEVGLVEAGLLEDVGAGVDEDGLVGEVPDEVATPVEVVEDGAGGWVLAQVDDGFCRVGFVRGGGEVLGGGEMGGDDEEDRRNDGGVEPALVDFGLVVAEEGGFVGEEGAEDDAGEQEEADVGEAGEQCDEEGDGVVEMASEGVAKGDAVLGKGAEAMEVEMREVRKDD